MNFSNSMRSIRFLLRIVFLLPNIRQLVNQFLMDIVRNLPIPRLRQPQLFIKPFQMHAILPASLTMHLMQLRKEFFELLKCWLLLQIVDCLALSFILSEF